MNSNPEPASERIWKPRDVVRYTPTDRNRSDRFWCREGLAIGHERPDGTVVLLDTYWGGSGDRHCLLDDELETVRFQFNLDDYETVRYESDWMMYHPDDRQIVTSQHRLQNTFYVRQGAAKNLDTQIENARAEVEASESKVKMAQWSLECDRRALAALIEKRDEAKADV